MDWAYVAGVFDGEGTLVVGRHTRKGNRGLAFRAHMAIADTHVPLLQAVKAFVGGGKIIIQGRKGCYSLSFSTSEIRRILPQMLPHLIVKHEQAEVLLRFLGAQSGNASAPLTPQLGAFYQECRTRLEKLKRVRYTFKEPVLALPPRVCEQCGKPFKLTSKTPRKRYCSLYCKRKTHWTRSNARIRDGRPAWGVLHGGVVPESSASSN